MHNHSAENITQPAIPNLDPAVGLSPEQVLRSRELYGDNTLTPAEKKSVWSQFVEKFNDPLIKILLVALLLSIGISVYELYQGARGMDVFLEPAGIATAIILATSIGFVLELSANKKFELLTKLNDDTPVRVVRSGNVTTVPRRDIVVGDTVLLESGDKVPADGTIIQSISLCVDESSLTGEQQVSKSHKPEHNDPEATYPTSKLLRGSMVLEGSAAMTVTAVGDCTEYGKVFEAVQIDTEVETPLSKQLVRLGNLIAYASYAIGALIIIGRTIIYDEPYLTLDFLQYSLTSIMLGVTLIVVSVPEGLPMSITLSLALSMRRMLVSNNLVRRMHACETMGAITVICTDKTGTLTKNLMHVNDYSLCGSETPTRLTALSLAANSTAFIDKSKAEHAPVGNPTEGAILMWLEAHGYDYSALRKSFEITGIIPFTTERKYMATEGIDTESGKKYLFIKGAPEILLEQCNCKSREQMQSALSEYQSHAMRTIGFAIAELGADESSICKGEISASTTAEFIGVVGIADPVRDDVPAAISQCSDSGIKVIIVTGDNPGTAYEIGRQTGVIHGTNDSGSALITGSEYAKLSDEEAMERASELRIMSRARPGDKARLVSLLQQRGEVVAVTGDGTNDAPALNAAHVGLAMGSGTAVAKEAGDITILDNSFASITKAVMWGRSLYRNIQRFILFQLTVNVAACIIVAIGAFTSFQSPLTVTQMLWVNLIMDTFAALALASLPPSAAVMHEKPRNPSQFIITGKMAVFIIGIGLLFTAVLFGLLQYIHHYDLASLSHFSLRNYASSYFDFDYSRSQHINTRELTIFFTIFIALQFWNLFNAKAYLASYSSLHIFKDFRSSLAFYFTAGAIVAGQAIIVAFGGEMFSVEPLPVNEFFMIFIVTAPTLLLGIPFKSRSH